jgi:hypothetical protein
MVDPDAQPLEQYHLPASAKTGADSSTIEYPEPNFLEVPNQLTRPTIPGSDHYALASTVLDPAPQQALCDLCAAY